MSGEKFTRASGDTFDSRARDGDVVVVAFSRREVDAGQIGDALDRLLNLSDNPDNVRRFRDRVSFVFEGRESDPREIHQVPEAVSFFRALTRSWPYWTHFAEKLGDTASLTIALLCDVVVVATGAGVTGCSLRDTAQLKTVLQQLFAGQNALYEAHGLSEDENMVTTDAFLAALDMG